MANHKSALKKMRQDKERREHNRVFKTRLKHAVKEVETAVANHDQEEAKVTLQKALSVIDRVASKGVIHKNKAARKKSRLSKKVNALAAREA